MMILQLNPPIHVMTPLGEAFAKLVIDYGPDVNPIFVCDIFKNRACVSIDSAEIRFGGNPMYDLQDPEPFKSWADYHGERDMKNRCVETMTKTTFYGYNVRVWSNCEQPDRALANFMGPDKRVVEVITEVLGFVLQVGLTESLEYLRDELEKLDHVAAYEIVDSEGQGVVVYPDWK